MSLFSWASMGSTWGLVIIHLFLFSTLPNTELYMQFIYRMIYDSLSVHQEWYMIHAVYIHDDTWVLQFTYRMIHDLCILYTGLFQRVARPSFEFETKTETFITSVSISRSRGKSQSLNVETETTSIKVVETETLIFQICWDRDSSRL